MICWPSTLRWRANVNTHTGPCSYRLAAWRAMLGRMERQSTAFGREVRRVRQQQHLTIKAVADAIPISCETLSKIERGVTHRPNDEILRGLERVLGIPRAYALEVLGALPRRSTSARVESLDRLVALPTPEARLRGWQHLPPHLKRSLIQLVHDVLAHGIPAMDGAAVDGAADVD